jgi:AraC-like DNA-binding protein
MPALDSRAVLGSARAAIGRLDFDRAAKLLTVLTGPSAAAALKRETGINAEVAALLASVEVQMTGVASDASVLAQRRAARAADAARRHDLFSTANFVLAAAGAERGAPRESIEALMLATARRRKGSLSVTTDLASLTQALRTLHAMRFINEAAKLRDFLLRRLEDVALGEQLKMLVGAVELCTHMPSLTTQFTTQALPLIHEHEATREAASADTAEGFGLLRHLANILDKAEPSEGLTWYRIAQAELGKRLTLTRALPTPNTSDLPEAASQMLQLEIRSTRAMVWQLEGRFLAAAREWESIQAQYAGDAHLLRASEARWRAAHAWYGAGQPKRAAFAYEQYKQQALGQLRDRAVARDAVAELIQRVTGGSRTLYVSQHSEPLAGRVTRLIRSRSLANLSVRSIAEALGVTPRAVQVAIKGRYGKTPIALIQDARLSKARALLLSSERPKLSTLAKLCGFATYKAFGRAYAKRYGESPESTCLRQSQEADA